ncbi:MAG: DNA-directed RNA polymerase subunit omega [Phycisphaerae bacterium]
MIEVLKDDEIINKLGGRFKLTALIQRRWVRLMQGARPMVETEGLTDLEVVLKEIVEGKIEPIFMEEAVSEGDDES